MDVSYGVVVNICLSPPESDDVSFWVTSLACLLKLNFLTGEESEGCLFKK